MDKKCSRGATALMTLAGLIFLLAVIGGVAILTRSEPLVSEPAGEAVVSETLGR